MCDHEDKACWAGCNCQCMNCLGGDIEYEDEFDEYGNFVEGGRP